MSRSQTLILALLVINLLLGCICLAAARAARDAAVLRLWGYGMLVYGAGLLLASMRYWLPAFALTFGNVLIALAPLVSIDGVLRYTRRRLSRPWVLAGLAATVLVLIVNNYAGGNAQWVNIAAPTAIALVLFTYGAIALAVDPPTDAVLPARVLAVLFLIAVAIWLLRVALLWNPVVGGGDRDWVDLVVAVFAIAQIAIAVSCTLCLFWIDISRSRAALEHMAFADPLTELPNRRATVARFATEAARATRQGQSFALAVFDIDHFKRVNDRYGHLAGDGVLKRVAHTLRSAKRGEDAVGRIGGEEFVVLLAEPNAKGAHEAADRLRLAVASAPFVHDGIALPVSMSAGVAMFESDGSDWDALFAAADARLYQAKQQGRNCVVGPFTTAA